MIGFLIKKAFFDFWDHLLQVALFNLGFILILAVPLVLPFTISAFSTVLAIILFVIGIVAFFIYTGIISLFCRDIANYQAPQISDFIPYLKESWKSSLLLAGIFAVHGVIVTVAMPFYSDMQSLIGFSALIILFWSSIFWLLAAQYYFPIFGQLEKNPLKRLKKSFIIFFDNTAFSFFIAIAGLTILILSGFTALLLPGITGILIWYNVALKLRLYKYDYLEKNPEANRKQIPWDSLLVDDREKVGKRTLKGMIFPWKE